jgi:hypothetical protein
MEATEVRVLAKICCWAALVMETAEQFKAGNDQ